MPNEYEMRVNCARPPSGIVLGVVENSSCAFARFCSVLKKILFSAEVVPLSCGWFLTFRIWEQYILRRVMTFLDLMEICSVNYREIYSLVISAIRKRYEFHNYASKRVVSNPSRVITSCMSTAIEPRVNIAVKNCRGVLVFIRIRWIVAYSDLMARVLPANRFCAGRSS